MSKLPEETIKARKEYAKLVNYDLDACRKEWRIRKDAVKYFIKEFCLAKKVITKPEYENQRLFDMQVLDRYEWCRKWKIPLWEYDSYLAAYEREHGEIATPEIRERWMREYWASMGE